MFRFVPLKHIILSFLLFVAYSAQSQDFSYVYIQGDKKTPFYVKFEGEMLPRYGKNYCIIPMLAPGPINIEILFQQRAYPSQKFIISVPETSNRSFLLKNRQGSFVLYDIQQKFSLPAGNTIEQDQVSAANGLAYSTSPQTKRYTEYVPANNNYQEPKKTHVVNKPVYKDPPTRRITTEEQPKFIANIQLNNGSSKKNTSVATQKPIIKNRPNLAENTPRPISKTIRTEQPRILKTTPTPSISRPVREQANRSNNTSKKKIDNRNLYNSDCPTPINNKSFDDIYDKATGKSDKVRLKYLLTEVDKCYSTFQAKTLALTLPNDPERYTFLKRVYPRVTDQEKFPVLEHILSTTDWKDYFKLIIPE